MSEYGYIQNTFTKEGAGVSFFFFWGGGGGGGGGGGLFFPVASLLKQ